MKHLYYIIVWLIFLSCGNDKHVSNNTIPLFKSLSALNQDKKKKIKYDYKFIQLETSDSVLLDRTVICDIKDSTMLVKSENIIYGFNTENGKHRFTIDRRGNGPSEYNRIGDLQYSPVNPHLYVYDYITNKILIYTEAGENIGQMKNDSISSMGISPQGDILVAYNPLKSHSSLIGIYDSSFHYVNSFIDNQSKMNKANLLRINPIYRFNEKNCIYIPDTFYHITTKWVSPFLVIDKGRYKIPEEIESDPSQKDIRENYIWDDYGLIAGQYLFLHFNYNNHSYFDLWDIKEKILIFRRCTSSPEQQGLAFDIEGQIIYAWPNYVCENKIYCVLDNEQSILVVPDYDIDNNPIILEITLI